MARNPPEWLMRQRARGGLGVKPILPEIDSCQGEEGEEAKEQQAQQAVFLSDRQAATRGPLAQLWTLAGPCAQRGSLLGLLPCHCHPAALHDV